MVPGCTPLKHGRNSCGTGHEVLTVRARGTHRLPVALGSEFIPCLPVYEAGQKAHECILVELRSGGGVSEADPIPHRGVTVPGSSLCSCTMPTMWPKSWREDESG